MGDWFGIEWYGAVVCFHRFLSEVFKPENSEGKGIIPEWQAVSPTNGQYRSVYRDGGEKGRGWRENGSFPTHGWILGVKLLW